MFPDAEEICVSRDGTRGAPLDSSGEVLVVIRIFADTAQHVVACNQIGQQHNSREPCFSDLWPNVLGHFRVAESAQHLVDDGR
jgi:hypothetical protein